MMLKQISLISALDQGHLLFLPYVLVRARLKFALTVRYRSFICVLLFYLRFTFLVAICFFVCVFFFLFALSLFICVFFFCLRFTFYLRFAILFAFWFFVCVLLFFICVFFFFCLRFLFFLFSFSFLFAFSFLFVFEPSGPPYISEATVKSQRIGITVKLETTDVPARDVTDRLCRFKVRKRVLLMYFSPLYL